jgi:hypothetical protein
MRMPTFFTKEYEPGEPYEFEAPRVTGGTVMRYRCFRGQCKGHPAMAPYVTDRNSHNRYHNLRGE